MPNFDNECFLISPIGEEGTPERKRADGVKKAVVEPAAQQLGLHVVRADEVSEPGVITTQIVEHLVAAKAVVADLTDGNPNVFYELAVRDAAQKSAVLIAQTGTALPFDKAASRTIFFDALDLSEAWDAQASLAEFLRASLEGRVENPIATAMIFKQVATSGTPIELAVAQLGEQISELGADVQSLKRRQEDPGSPNPWWALRERSEVPSDSRGLRDHLLQSKPDPVLQKRHRAALTLAEAARALAEEKPSEPEPDES